MALIGGQNTAYQDELKSELEKFEPSDFPHAARLISEEVKRVESGDKHRYVSMIEVHHNRPQSSAVKVKIPIKEFPKFNFVGKLLGPKGSTLKQLQEETGCKLSILGRGSIRDKNKEEELRKEGGKYAHLNEDLHVLVEVFSESTDAYARLAHALAEVKKYMVPDHNDAISMQQMQLMQMSGGDQPPVRGRGRGRGGPGGPPGGPLGRGGLLNTPGGRGGRGAPGGAPAPSPRGALRGGRGGPMGGRGRGGPASLAPPAPAVESYDDYGAGGRADTYDTGYSDPYADRGGYGDSTYDSSYSDPYADTSYGSQTASDTQYFDYGHGAASSGYDDYGGQTGGFGSTGLKAPPPRGGRGGTFRSRPY